MENTEKRYFGKEIGEEIFEMYSEIFEKKSENLFERTNEGDKYYTLNYWDKEFHAGRIKEQKAIYKAIKEVFPTVKDVSENLITNEELSNLDRKNYKEAGSYNMDIQYIKRWTGDMSFFYCLCHTMNLLSENSLRKEMKSLEKHITKCFNILFEKEHLLKKNYKGSDNKGRPIFCNIYTDQDTSLIERLFLFIKNEYPSYIEYSQSYIYDISSIENDKMRAIKIKNFMLFFMLNDKKELWKNINRFIIGYYCKYSMNNYNSELSATNEKWNPKTDSYNWNETVESFYFQIGNFSHERLETKFKNLDILFDCIHFDSLINKRNESLKHAFEWVFKNKFPEKATAYKLFKEIKIEFEQDITEYPAIALVMYELMKKMTVHEFKDIFPEAFDKAHLNLAHKNWDNYLGNYLKQQYPESYDEVLIKTKFEDKRNLNAESKLLQSMMFFMIWDIVASLKANNEKDAQIPDDKKSNMYILKQAIMAPIIKAIHPAVKEKQVGGCFDYHKDAFDKENAIFKFDEKEEQDLIEFSVAIIEQMKNKNYISEQGYDTYEYDGEKQYDYMASKLYNKFEYSKAVSKYRKDYTFQWHTSQCQEKLLNDLAKDFKLNAGGLYFDFDQAVLLLEKLKNFVKELPIENEYNNLKANIETLIKEKEPTEEFSWDYLKKVYFILDNYEESKAENLQKEWFEFYKLDINQNKNKYKDLIKDTYKVLKRFSNFDELYNFLLRFDDKSNYTDNEYKDIVEYIQFLSISPDEFKKKLLASKNIWEYISALSEKHTEIENNLLCQLKIKYIDNNECFNNILSSWNKKEIEDKISSSKIVQKYFSTLKEKDKEVQLQNLICLSIIDKSGFEEALSKNNLDEFKYYISPNSYCDVNEDLCFEWNSLKKILFLMENSSKSNAKKIINELLEFQKLDLKENQEKHYKLLKQVYNIIKNYPAILKDIRNNISKEKIERSYNDLLKTLQKLKRQEKFETGLSWGELKFIHLILDQYKESKSTYIRTLWYDLPYDKNKKLEYIKENPEKYKDLLKKTYNLVKSYSSAELKDLVLKQIEKVKTECKKHKIKEKQEALFFTERKKEYAGDFIANVKKFLDAFQSGNGSQLKKDCNKWINELDSFIYRLQGTNIKICSGKSVKEISAILYPILKNSNIARKEKDLIRKLRKIYASDNPFAYTNLKITKNNISAVANLIYNISHYIAKEKAYAIGQINFIKEEKLKYLSTQEKIPKQFRNQNNTISFSDTCKLLDNLEKMEKAGTSKEEIKESIKPFISDENRNLITSLKINRSIWKKLDRGFDIPKFGQTLKSFISPYHCFDEGGDAILSREITCKLNDESDTVYDWSKPIDYVDANACNMKAIYFTRLRNSEEHYTLHGSIENLLDEKYWYNLLWSFIDAYKYLDQKNTWSGNNVVIPIIGRLHCKCYNLMRWFVQKEAQDLTEILWNKTNSDNLRFEDLNFWNGNTKDIKEIMETIKKAEIKDLNYHDKYFTDNLFIERIQKLLGFMYCSNGLSMPSSFNENFERINNKNNAHDDVIEEDFLDFYRVPTALYLIYLTMALSEENIEEIKKTV